ncbi:PhzF family phenazine biosynthesis protein [Clostridium sp. MD294]|uniref:PhzF family phenazine biosynthesis protein n=1 Tax=Clostridium sp. MD294 TaxID=97138 RepID=UPI0002CBCD01|nr:PhzF family phenazine biosynthesis protein [Clostridium sp. MD294]NDO47161.1 PhzF family phenazine biosynthesis protein [Clostridium sp. MD294]USF29775.1 putative isomerase YddE [Clostridium sp. MD294]
MKYFVIDAFAEKVFQGNPAGVCILEKPLKQRIMQNIAKENNLSETAFVYKEKEQYFLKWFTPISEIDLCGHATMAAAYVIMNFIEKMTSVVTFHTKSGILIVEKKGNLFEMDLPCYMPEKIDVIEKVTDVIGIKPVETYISRDLIILLENENQVKNIKPDFDKMEKLNIGLGVVVTAKGKEVDFVSRYFTPELENKEDAVTGSSHSSLIPFWAKRLQKNDMVAKQISERGGILYCKNKGQRVKVSGTAVLYMMGEINIEY